MGSRQLHRPPTQTNMKLLAPITAAASLVALGQAGEFPCLFGVTRCRKVNVFCDYSTYCIEDNFDVSNSVAHDFFYKTFYDDSRAEGVFMDCQKKKVYKYRNSQ